ERRNSRVGRQRRVGSRRVEPIDSWPKRYGEGASRKLWMRDYPCRRFLEEPHASGQRSALTARWCGDTISNSPVRKSPKRVWVMQGCANRQFAAGAPTERKQ